MDQYLTLEEIQELPELAILVALEAVLQSAILSLHAAHPELIEDEPNPLLSDPLTSSACAADAIVRLAASLEEAIDRYRLVTFHRTHFVSRKSHDDVPF